LSNIFVGFLENLRHQKGILKLTDLLPSLKKKEERIINTKALRAALNFILSKTIFAKQNKLF